MERWVFPERWGRVLWGQMVHDGSPGCDPGQITWPPWTSEKVLRNINRTSWVVQWWRLCTFSAGVGGSSPGWGTRIPHAKWWGQWGLGRGNVSNSGTCLMLRRRQWRPTPVLLPAKSHGQGSLGGCSPWGREESDWTERLHFHFSLSPIRESNGNPLQCSYLENPRDGGAWWAAVYGVAQSRTRLKWLSSSSLLLKVGQVWTKTDGSLQMPCAEADGAGCSTDWSPWWGVGGHGGSASRRCFCCVEASAWTVCSSSLCPACLQLLEIRLYSQKERSWGFLEGI